MVGEELYGPCQRKWAGRSKGGGQRWMLGNEIAERDHHCHEEVQDVPMAWVAKAELRSRA